MTQTCPIVTLEQSVLHLLYLGTDMFLLIIPKQDVRHRAQGFILDINKFRRCDTILNLRQLLSLY